LKVLQYCYQSLNPLVRDTREDGIRIAAETVDEDADVFLPWQTSLKLSRLMMLERDASRG